jgi:hypothetical protein
MPTPVVWHPEAQPNRIACLRDTGGGTAVAQRPGMVFGILMVVATIVLAIVAYRVMSKPVPTPAAPPPEVDAHELEAIRLGLPRHTPRPRGPMRQSLPPVTLETLPPPGLVRPSEPAVSTSLPAAIEAAAPASIVPAIDHSVFAALATQRPSATPLPQKLARGSVAPTFTPPPDDLDDAETIGGGSNHEPDDDVLTRAHTPPVG